MNDIEKLLAIESIKQTKARYFRCLDTKDWQGLESTFAPDAQMDMRELSRNPDNLIIGSRRIVEFVSGSLQPLITVHHGHTVEIEFTSDTAANVILAMEDILWRPSDTPGQKPVKYVHGWGHYRETYRNLDGHWLIQTTTLTRLNLEVGAQ
jgi:SnoaL-like domain